MLAGLLLVPTPTASLARSTDKPEARPGAVVALAAKPKKRAFQVGGWELQTVSWNKLRLNGMRPMPIKTIGPQDDKGVPMRPLGPRQKLVYNPTVLAQQGIRRLDTWRQTGKRVHLRYARKIAEKLDEIAIQGKKRRWQPHDYQRGGKSHGWVNANSHGLVLSFLSRFNALTGSAGRLADAKLMIEPFRNREDDKLWFVTITPTRHIWFEHWPDGRFVHTLNAHLNALFGLYDYWAVTGSKAARRYFLGGAQTVRAKLHLFRREGKLSRYSLSGKSGSLHYHHTHIHQLRILARMTGDDWFSRQADKFKQDERAWRAAGRPD